MGGDQPSIATAAPLTRTPSRRFSGTATLLLTFTLPKALRYASIGALCTTLVVVPLLYLLIRTQARFLSGLFGFLARRGIAPKLMTRIRPRAAVLEERVYGFYERNQGRFLSIFLLDCCFHVAGVLEVYVTLSFISSVGPTLTQAPPEQLPESHSASDLQLSPSA